MNDTNQQMLIAYCRTGWIIDNRMTDDEFTPLAFINGNLTSIGRRELGGMQSFGDTGSAERDRELRRRQQQQQDFNTMMQRLCLMQTGKPC